MGRVADTIAHWGGSAAPVRALLESEALILRGGIKARLPRETLVDVRVDGDLLCLRAGDAPLVLELGGKEAERWHAALLKPLPSLADKLGMSAARPALYVCPAGLAVAELDGALAGCRTDDVSTADQIVALLACPADLDAALALAAAHPALPIWCVHAKGRGASPGDAEVRAAFRAAGRMDNKTSGISATFTATRYGPQRG